MPASKLSKKRDLHASFKILNEELKKDLAKPFIYLLIQKHFHRLTACQASSHTFYIYQKTVAWQKRRCNYDRFL